MSRAKTRTKSGEASQWRWILVITVIIAIAMITFAVTTLMDMDVVYNCASPVVSLLSALLICISRENLGIHWKAARWFMAGFLIWGLGDIFWILQTYIFDDAEWIVAITDNIYLIPDFFYIGALFTYAKNRFSKYDLQVLLIDTFLISVFAFIIAQNVLEHTNPDYNDHLEILNKLLYFFATLFTLVMLIMIYLKTGVKRHAKAFHVVTVVLFLHAILEARFTVLLFLGWESENPYLDILYLFFIAVIAAALAFGNLKDADFGQDSRINNLSSRLHRNYGWIYWAIVGLVFISSGILYLLDFFDGADIFFIVTSSMAYVIMCKTVQASVLSEELINRQKSENARLEQMVVEKTKELQEMNAYLEKISNTDVLTGLYNRRYGLELISNLVKDGSTYPIVLYSLDLNYFKPINDNYGHDMGDVVLKEVGRRLASLHNSRYGSCTSIRIGGDEFLVIYKNAGNMRVMEDLGRYIAEQMDEPIQAKVVSEEKGELEHTFQISAGIGAARFPADTTDIDALFKMADQALYKIKHTHEKSACLFYSQIPEKERESL